jgi:hypothetical protein
VNGSPAVIDTACDTGTVCMTTQAYGRTVGKCCLPDHSIQVSLDGGVPVLTCAGGGACPTDLCPVGSMLTGITRTCCPSGTSCKTASVMGMEMSACCAGDLCPRVDLFGDPSDVFGIECCDSGQSCMPGLVPSSGICCSAGGNFCIQDGGTPMDRVCCADGHECVSPSFGLGGIPGSYGSGQHLSVCCPIGSTAEFRGGTFSCVVPCAQPCNPFGPGGGCCNPPGPDCTRVCDHPIWGLACCDELLPPPPPPCDNPCPMGTLTACCDPGVCGGIISIPFAGSIGTCSFG